MLRLTGVLLIFLAFSSIGVNISSGIKRKLERLILFRKMTDEIATLIRYRSLTVREIILLLGDNDLYNDFCIRENIVIKASRQVKYGLKA